MNKKVNNQKNAESKSEPKTGPFLPGPRTLEDPLCRVVLVEPLIPENSGNISRTCVGTESELHFVGPMGFEITEARVKRAGLDYWPHLAATMHDNYETWAKQVPDPSRVFFIETSGEKSIYEAGFKRGDWLVFGKETSGLTHEQMARFEKGLNAEGKRSVYSLPMPGKVRSLNLANAVAVTIFELLRQTEVDGTAAAP